MIKPFIIQQNWKMITIDNVKPGYYISDIGNVYSAISNTMLTPILVDNGYLVVHLATNDGGSILRKIHRLVMMTFCYYSGCEHIQVNHKDGIKTHNWIWNLEWSTPKENIAHAIEHNLRPSFKGDNNPLSKITFETARNIGNMLIAGYSDSYICKTLNVPNIDIIQQIARGKTWNHIFSAEELELIKKTRRGYHLSDEQYHSICKYFQDHNNLYDYNYGKVKNICSDALNSIGVNVSDTNLRIAKRLYYRRDRNDITSLYNY